MKKWLKWLLILAVVWFIFHLWFNSTVAVWAS